MSVVRFLSPRQVARSLKGNLGVPRYYLGGTRIRRDDMGQPGETVLLIQGFLQTRGVLETLEHRLRADGFRVVSFHLGGLLDHFNTRGIDELSELVGRKMERLRERHGIESAHVVGHSMGGLVARGVVLDHGGGAWVRTVITLGTPHHGTPTAALVMPLGLPFVSRASRQLLPKTPLIRSLQERPFPASVRLVSVYSQADLVCPWTRSVLTPRDGDDVRNVFVRGLGHMDLVEDPWVYGLILRELKGRPTDSASGPLVAADEESTASDAG